MPAGSHGAGPELLWLFSWCNFAPQGLRSYLQESRTCLLLPQAPSAGRLLLGGSRSHVGACESLAQVRAGPRQLQRSCLRQPAGASSCSLCLLLPALPLRLCLCPFSTSASPFAWPRRSPSSLSLSPSPLSVLLPPFPSADSGAAPPSPHSSRSGSRRFFSG